MTARIAKKVMKFFMLVGALDECRDGRYYSDSCAQKAEQKLRKKPAWCPVVRPWPEGSIGPDGQQVEDPWKVKL